MKTWVTKILRISNLSPIDPYDRLQYTQMHGKYKCEKYHQLSKNFCFKLSERDDYLLIYVNQFLLQNRNIHIYQRLVPQRFS